MKKVCIIGASGKLGRYMVAQALERGYAVTAVCRPESMEKLADSKDTIHIIGGRTNDRDIIRRAVAGCDGVLCVLVPWGRDTYSSGTAQAVLDNADPNDRLVFSSGWHISRDGRDIYSKKFLRMLRFVSWITRLLGLIDIRDQEEACRRIFASDSLWTLVRGSDLEEGESEGLPVWSRHVGDPILQSNITRRIDFALFMVDALTRPELIHEAPAIVSRLSPSALAHGREETA
ncbi:short-chain dehydrogenase [Marispirochaeta aestuarii]|uniref:Short-chain dehydrogenase n=1 Tax=Marispirochaeta aestuarii TaxID=1963862 RepID=A0A1Y1RUA3_9SPIO|nr:NAD(P)H-binding protein [Marispirochaeta aestuarii]ORC30302.1 short-chain dehydrogenase [Marispirochaeta aestuarii]